MGHAEPFKESLHRLTSFAEAGADVLFAPGIHRRDDIKAMTNALEPKPVNVLVSRDTGLTVADLAELGVRRVSLGSTLARAAWSRFMEVAKDIATEGRFTSLDGIASYADINGFFRDESRDR